MAHFHKSAFRFRHIRLAVLLVLPLALGCEFSFNLGDHETHGPAPPSPELVVEAPAKHVVSVATIYYDHQGNSTSWKSQTARHIIPDSGKLTLDMEASHDGYRVELMAPASIEVTAKLLSEGKPLKQKSLKSGGMLTLKAGKLRKEDERRVEDLRLPSGDRRLVAAALEAFKSGDMHGVISHGDDAVVDAPMLRSLSSAVEKRFGEMKTPALDGWAAWDVNNDATIAYGQLVFDRGTAFASVVLRNDKVVGVRFESAKFPSEWFESLAESKTYRERGEKMVRAMLAGDMPAAYETLDAIYHDQISIDDLANLAKQKLPSVKPDQIESIEVVDETYSKKESNDTTAYSIFYEVVTADGAKTVLRVPFELIVEGDNKIGRLSGFQFVSQTVGEQPAKTNQASTGSQSEPANQDSDLSWVDRQKALIAEMVGHMASANTEALEKMLHEDAQKFVDRAKLEAELTRIAARLGPAIKADATSIEVDNADHNLGAGSSFSGTFRFENGAAECRVQYSGHKPVGISVEADGFAADTYCAVKPPEELVKHAREFWLASYNGDPDKAYDLMIPPGKENVFPRDVFKNLVKQLTLPAGVEPRTMHLNEVRFNNTAENSDTLHVNVYQLLERSDDRYSTCRLRYEMKKDGKFQIVKFDTGQFEDRYPLSDFAMQERFLAAMSTGDAQQVLPLIHPFDLNGIHIPTFAAFVKQFAESTGEFRSIDPQQMSAMRIYDKEGGQRTDAAGIAVFEKRTVEFSCNHVYGLLEGFDFEDPDGLLDGFEKRIDDLTAHEEHGEKWLREMLDGDVEQAIRMLPSDFRKQVEPQTEEIKKSRTEFLAETGPLKSIKVVGREFIEEDNLWQINYEMQFENDGAAGYIRYESTPFTGLIFAFNYKRNKATENQPGEPDEK